MANLFSIHSLFCILVIFIIFFEKTQAKAIYPKQDFGEDQEDESEEESGLQGLIRSEGFKEATSYASGLGKFFSGLMSGNISKMAQGASSVMVSVDKTIAKQAADEEEINDRYTADKM